MRKSVLSVSGVNRSRDLAAEDSANNDNESMIVGIIGPEIDDEISEQHQNGNQLLQDDKSVRFDQDGIVVNQSFDIDLDREKISGRNKIKKTMSKNMSKVMLAGMSQITLPTVQTHGHSLATLQHSSLSQSTLTIGHGVY